MYMTESTLAALGWDDWFEAQQGSLCGADAAVARVSAVDRDQLLLLGEAGLFRARLSGKWRRASGSAAARPCVGDWVCVDLAEPGQTGIVQEVFERRTCLRRRAAGDSAAEQMIAANVDCVIVVLSCHYDFNLKRLERYLVMIGDGGAAPLILLTKTDLVTPQVLTDQLAQIENAGIKAPVASLSNVTGEGQDGLFGMLVAGRTYCFVGSSGVGKSTIINHLVGAERLQTSAVSGTGEGRHTTVRRELLLLDNGALVIDNPGMREFGVVAAEDGIEAGFADILALAANCRFRDCSHRNEPGCAVLAALERDQIDAQHYDNFGKLQRESSHYALTYAQKRKKDRDFGRFIKSVKKDLEQD